MKEFVAETAGELALSVNDLVTITYDPNAGSDEHRWVYGYKDSTLEEGWFPMDFAIQASSTQARKRAGSENSGDENSHKVDQILAVVRMLPEHTPRSVKEFLEDWAREEALNC